MANSKLTIRAYGQVVYHGKGSIDNWRKVLPELPENKRNAEEYTLIEISYTSSRAPLTIIEMLATKDSRGQYVLSQKGRIDLDELSRDGVKSIISPKKSKRR